MNRIILHLFSIIVLLLLAFVIAAQPTLAHPGTPQPVQTPAAFGQAQDQGGEAAPTLCVKYDPYFCYHFKQEEKPQPVQAPVALEQAQDQAGEVTPKFCVKYDPYFCYHVKQIGQPQPVQAPVALEQAQDQAGEAAPKFCVKYDPYFCYHIKQGGQPQPVQIFAAVNQEAGQVKEEVNLQPVQPPAGFEQGDNQAGEAAPKICVRYDPYICYGFKPEGQSTEYTNKYP